MKTTERRTTGAAIAAKSIREELKRKFPGIKFAVTSKSYSGGNSVNVAWDMGPTGKMVDAVIGKYQYGEFDGMEDIYRYNQTICVDEKGEIHDLPSAKYVFSNRHIPDAWMDQLMHDICEIQQVAYLGPYTQTGCGEVRNLAYRCVSEHDLTSVTYGGVYWQDGKLIIRKAVGKRSI